MVCLWDLWKLWYHNNLLSPCPLLILEFSVKWFNEQTSLQIDTSCGGVWRWEITSLRVLRWRVINPYRHAERETQTWRRFLFMHRKPFSLTSNVSLGDWLPTHCMQSSLCRKWVWVRRTLWCGIKNRADVPWIHFPPYHPDDPECQLPSVLWGVCCQSGCVCVWRHREADAVTLPTVHSTGV